MSNNRAGLVETLIGNLPTDEVQTLRSLIEQYPILTIFYMDIFVFFDKNIKETNEIFNHLIVDPALKKLESGRVYFVIKGKVDFHHSAYTFKNASFFVLKDDLHYSVSEDAVLASISKSDVGQDFYHFVESITDLRAQSSQNGHSSSNSHHEKDEIELSSVEEIVYSFKKNKITDKVTFFLQENEMECGTASLSMLASLYEKQVNRYHFRNLVFPNKDGCSLLQLIKAAQVSGYLATVKKSDFTEAPFDGMPFIALTKYHFVVVTKLSRNKIHFIDPKQRKKSVKVEYAKANWTGYCLAIAPDSKTVMPPKEAESKTLFFDIPSFYNLAIVLLFLSLILSLNDLVESNLVRLVFNQDPATSTYLLILFILPVIYLIFNYIMVKVFQFGKVDKTIFYTEIFVNKVIKTKYVFLRIINPADIFGRIGDVSSVITSLLKIPSSLIAKIFTIVFFCFLLASFHKYYIIIILVSALLQLIIILALKNYYINQMQALIDTKNSREFKLSDFILGFKTIISSNNSFAAKNEVMQLNEKFITEERKNINYHTFVGLSVQSIESASRLITIIFTLYLYEKKQIKIGDMMIAITVVTSIIKPLVKLLLESTEYLSIQLLRQRIGGLCNYPSHSGTLLNDDDNNSSAIGITLKDVTYTYPGDAKGASLRDITLSIQPKDFVIILGESGSGKSTLGMLLAGLEQPSSGVVSHFDAKGVMTTDQITKSTILFTGSDPVFNLSLKDNITFQKDTKHLKLAFDYIDSLDLFPGVNFDFDTYLPTFRDTLSTGQLQKLLFARCLYLQPKLIVMDEQFSSLDQSSEEKIIFNMKSFFPESTIILITHRFQIAKYTDKILFLKGGHFTSFGKHKELLCKDPGYASHYFEGLEL
jgi:subfamily B ATP-binding cassette protein HlyB/CyaB